MSNRLRISIIFIIALLLAGCGDQRVLERLGFTHTVSYDLIETDEDESDRKLMISISIPRPESGTGSGDGRRQVLTAVSSTAKEGRYDLSRQTELMLVSGQLRNSLFGLSLAKQGIWEQIDTLVRDPSISPRTKITVVNGNAHELLVKEYPQHPRTAQFIDRMLEKEEQATTIPKSSIHEFTKDYLDDGIDPVAPMIRINGDDIIVDGIALFKDDHYVMKIEPSQALIFAFLRGNFTHGEISINLSEVGRENEKVMFSSLVSKRKVKAAPSKVGAPFKVDVYIDVTGSVLEYIGNLDINSSSDRNKVEQLISDYAKIKAEEMIKTVQEQKVDSFGLGKYVRTVLSYEQWSDLNWDEVYPDIEVNCHAKVRIKDAGKFMK